LQGFSGGAGGISVLLELAVLNARREHCLHVEHV
jgi:hypothetical protein